MVTINLGIIGLGRGFMLTLPALRAHPIIRLSGAFDLRGEALSRFKTEFGASSHHSLSSLLADDKIDAVYIASPHEHHATQTIAALRAGKHVLVEKPMATNIADCAAMAIEAKTAGRVLIVGPSHGFDEPVRRAAALVASGRYGRVRMVTTLNFTDFMYRPRRAEELDTTRAGGVVFSQAAHQIDVVRGIVGDSVSAVRAVAGNWDAGRPSEGAYCALMSFVGGAAATLTYSGYAHYDSDELMGWVSELGQVKDPDRYGDARRALASLNPAGEQQAKLLRTYGAKSDGLSNPAPHHEHFGFILISCEKADFKLLPTGIHIYANDDRTFLPIASPELARAGVIEEFVMAVSGRAKAVHDGRWGLETMACCTALLESSEKSAEVDPRTLINPDILATGVE